MMRTSVAVALGFSFFLFAGCGDDDSGTVGPDEFGARAAQEIAIEGDINQLLTDLFPSPDTAQPHTLFAATKSSLATGDTADARQSASELLELAAATELEDPPGAEGFSELIDLLAEFVGITPPNIDPGLLDVDGDDGTVALALDDEHNLILTEQEFAGTIIEDEDIDDDLVIVIERVTEEERDGACLPTDLEQREGCYRFDRFPEGTFQDSVRVGVCQEEPVQTEDYQLHRFETLEEGVVPLPNVAFSQLDCGDFVAVRSSRAPLPWRLARSAWSATGGRLLDWIGPRPLRAVDAGFGGSTLDFSRIGWVKAMDVDVVAGDDQFAPPGSRVAIDPQVVVTHLPEGRDNLPIQETEVTFTVLEGDGTLNVGPNTSVTDTTDSNGLASVAWTLGNPGLNRLEAVVPGDTVLFTANAGDSIFVADFNDEPAGSPPQDPLIGEWSSVLGKVEIRADQGLLDDQPVVLEDTAGIGGGFPILNGKTAVIATSGVYQVAWQMAVDSLRPSGRASFSVSDPAGPVIGKVAMEDDGDIVAGTQDTALSDTGVDWEDGVPNSFLLTVDLDVREVSLRIGDTDVLVDAPLQAGATSLQRIEMASSGTTPPVTAAFDDIVVVRN